MLDFLFLVGKLEELGYPGNTAETALINSGGEVDKVERHRHFIIKFSSQSVICIQLCISGLYTGFENIGRGEGRRGRGEGRRGRGERERGGEGRRGRGEGHLWSHCHSHAPHLLLYVDYIGISSKCLLLIYVIIICII